MTDQAVRVEQSGPVSTVFLHRPARRNAVDGPTAAQLAAAFREFDADPGTSVAVLHGEGEVQSWHDRHRRQRGFSLAEAAFRRVALDGSRNHRVVHDAARLARPVVPGLRGEPGHAQ